MCSSLHCKHSVPPSALQRVELSVWWGCDPRNPCPRSAPAFPVLINNQNGESMQGQSANIFRGILTFNTCSSGTLTGNERRSSGNIAYRFFGSQLPKFILSVNGESKFSWHFCQQNILNQPFLEMKGDKKNTQKSITVSPRSNTYAKHQDSSIYSLTQVQISFTYNIAIYYRGRHNFVIKSD